MYRIIFLLCAIQLALAVKKCPPVLTSLCECNVERAGGDEDVGDVLLSCVGLDQKSFVDLTANITGYDFNELNFRHSTFTKLHAFAFANVTINRLNIENVTISYVDVDAFSKVPHLETVIIRRTQIAHIPIFKDIAHSLIEMSITYNNIQKVLKEEFVDLVNLEEIDLNHNDISEIDDEAFYKMKHLKNLYLDRNSLSSIGKWFNNSMLTVLSLEHNNIKSFPADLFKMLPNLEELDIDDNELTDIPEDIFKDFLHKEFSELHIDNNNIICDTRLCWLYKYYEGRKESNLFGKCSGPAGLSGTDISGVDDVESVKCPKHDHHSIN